MAAVVEEIATDLVAEALAGRDVLPACAQAICVLQVIMSAGRQRTLDCSEAAVPRYECPATATWSTR